jgi:hypothetical protein
MMVLFSSFGDTEYPVQFPPIDYTDLTDQEFQCQTMVSERKLVE